MLVLGTTEGHKIFEYIQISGFLGLNEGENQAQFARKPRRAQVARLNTNSGRLSDTKIFAYHSKKTLTNCYRTFGLVKGLLPLLRSHTHPVSSGGR